MMRRCIAVLALVGCGDPAPAADAGTDAVDVPDAVDAPNAVDAPAKVDVGEVAVDSGRLIPPCAAPTGGDGGVSVRGHAFVFGPPGGRVRDGVVTVLEHPGWCARTDADGAYALTGFAPGERATIELHHAAQWPILTSTLVVPAGGAERVAFQSPTPGILRVLAQYVRVTPDPARCQIATTVIADNFTGYDPGGHGEVGATVTIDPPVPAEAGPIYFRYLGPGAIVPDRTLAATTLDGGVVFVNVPPGDYVLTAHKDGVRFTTATVHCRAGTLVNAAPPWALQTYGPARR